MKSAATDRTFIGFTGNLLSATGQMTELCRDYSVWTHSETRT